MKAPDTEWRDSEWRELQADLAANPPGTYTGAQWQAIRASLAAVGVDLDTATTDIVLPNSGPSARKRALCDVLQKLAWYFAFVATGILQRRGRESRRRVVQLQRELAAFKAALAVLDNAKCEFYFGITDELRVAAHGALHDELTDLIARLQARLDQLTRRDGGNTNARTEHGEFWVELKRLWETLTADRPRRRRHKLLLRFLVACSAPLFPIATTDTAVTAFIERNSRKRKAASAVRLRD